MTRHTIIALAAVALTLAACSDDDEYTADNNTQQKQDEHPTQIAYPAALQQGDKIAIITPAGKIDAAVIDSACKEIESRGFVAAPSAHCKGAYGYYSGTDDERLADLKDALADPTVRAILCSRGGYGAVHLIENIDRETWLADPKWIIGYSDITALHAAANWAGLASIHGPMAKEIGYRKDAESANALFALLQGEMPQYTIAGDEHNRTGEVEGMLVGGNLSVASGLTGSTFQLYRPDCILFIEDVGEEIYSVERMLYTMKLDGTLSHIKGLIVGQFSGYEQSASFSTMEDMIEQMVATYDFPVVYNFPVGHVDHNMPLVEGSWCKLTVTPTQATLTMTKDNHK